MRLAQQLKQSRTGIKREESRGGGGHRREREWPNSLHIGKSATWAGKERGGMGWLALVKWPEKSLQPLMKERRSCMHLRQSEAVQTSHILQVPCASLIQGQAQSLAGCLVTAQLHAWGGNM